MLALFSLLLIILLSMLVTRVVTVALVHTGMSKDVAAFQAASAFSGAGFTTSEAESIVNHPVRRRIILITMRLGSVGVVTIISSVVLTFVEAGGTQEWGIRLALMLVGVGALWFITSSRVVDRKISDWITMALERWTDIDVRDYASLLNVAEEYRIGEIMVNAEDWLAEHQLAELGLGREGVLVLGIYRTNGDFVGTPIGETMIHADDRLIVYGRGEQLLELSERRDGLTGYLAHQQAVTEQIEILEEQLIEEI